MAYRRSGSGEPVLLVYGITTNSFIWREIIPSLETGFDVIAVDLLGCGESDLSLDLDYSINALAELLAAFIHELGIGPSHFVGHDIGERIAQILAVRHPNPLRSLTHINPVGYNFWPVQPIIAKRTPILRQMVMSTIDLPTLILRGDGDVHLSDEICTRLHGDEPNSRLERIATGGHFVQIDEPVWMADNLKRFFLEASA